MLDQRTAIFGGIGTPDLDFRNTLFHGLHGQPPTHEVKQPHHG